MSDAPRTGRSDRDWVTLLGGVRVSWQWMTRHTPELLAAWLDAATAARRRSIAAEIVHIAAELESEPVGAEVPGSPAWEAVAERIDPRLLLGPDWWPLSAALARAAVAGYDVSTRLPVLGAAAPLPDRHPARELHWRLLDDCPAALPVPEADGGPATPPPR
ncbi:hypothetical protein DQ237_00995 [Blastococcus sp. TF02-8]|uniref:hypothetical protein n=1 Tax=Blastococcus sp. TF02-8 TaxID=2250574 RepID=UPI000DE997A2|nr:hypothetical protein [Blastococcus sp. TF02-8]RBY97555.1 hypothetical protein DQ237_00995 [Blastococcus sp. TF02-8]